MKRMLPFMVSVAVLCAALGCGSGVTTGKGGPRTFEELYLDEWKVVEDVVIALESVKDKASAKAAAARINAACDRLEELYKEGRKLPRMSSEEILKVTDKYRDENAKLGGRYIDADAKARAKADGVPEFVQATLRYMKKSWATSK